ncbi:MAG TPA: M48 family metalloprotease [Hyphomicrobiales bacterium]|nr:M48 family metalloprotease [Hyphomicrobiales bacterium]
MGWFANRLVSVASAWARRAASLGLALAIIAATLPWPAVAQDAGQSKLTPVRDTEIEDLLRDYATPLFQAAGLNPRAIDIVLIADLDFNAFAADDHRIFVDLGTLIDSRTPNELIGVLAHETGHIADGHIAALRQKMHEASTRAIIAMLVGLAAVAGGAAAGGSAGQGLMSAAPAALIGGPSLVARDLLAYRRGQEQAADNAGVKYLTMTGQSAKGMLDAFRRLDSQAMFGGGLGNPYLLDHPMPQERLALLERLAKASPYFDRTDPPALVARHRMAQAKAFAFLHDQGTTLRRYPPGDDSLPARYARAIAAYRFGAVDAAQREIDALIQREPGNPYFWELKGQALLEAGRARQALAPLAKALALKPGAALIRVLYGTALIGTRDRKLNDQAIRELKAAVAREPHDVDAFRELAIALGRDGRLPDADLASAQAEFEEGHYPLAKQLATRAQKGYPRGSPGWLRAGDIADYVVPKTQ